ncbi:MAG: class I SAM-dependent methyltransferase [Actinobacteria bacterium]|nr:class I SAM-dependent methyltransferase [Actinomycetota bacterium]MBU4401595.1 class I SAM-dependent methyltransferase [Actinomycetota bacterium]MCG2820046.1 class I SAM-dependent methyltransferase [Actinomycetes bacterium]
MVNEKYRIIQDPVYGYKRIDPIPSEADIAVFYQARYYDQIKKGGRAPELRRLMAGGDEAERERTWLRSTLYSDICFVLNQSSVSRRVLDVGCGTGELVSYMKENGFDAVGIEPSSDAVAVAVQKGLDVYNTTLGRFPEHYRSDNLETFDAVIFLNVLEHVTNPAELIELTKGILSRGGKLCVRVPNDFSEIQMAVKKSLNKDAWWIAIPDHVNYFDFHSLHSLLQCLGFEVIYSQGDFPMELFLLMGDDYVDDSEAGSVCHQKRVRFEMSISGEMRRHIYMSLAEVGLGRSCLVFGRLREE